MTGIISDFVLSATAEIIEVFGNMMVNIFRQTLYPERFLSQVLNETVITNITQITYGFSVSLLVLKILKKGFAVYILWRDGDPDSSPQEMIMGSVSAVVISISFPTLYAWMTDITVWFGTRVFDALSGSGTRTWAETIQSFVLSLGGQSLINGIMLLILSIQVVILMLQLLKRGLELFVLRLGIPIATIGMVDSDGGVWKPYIKIFFQSMFTTIIQIFLMQLAFAIAVVMTASVWGMLWAISAMQASLKLPVLMQQLLVSAGGGGGGGGIGQKVYTTMHVVNAVKSIMK